MLHEQYAKKGVQFLHCLSGEGPRTGRDFQRHYRSTFPYLIDPDRSLEQKFNRNGWPFYLIADAKGNVVFGDTVSLSDAPELDRVLDLVVTGKPAKTRAYLGTNYSAETGRKNALSRRVHEIMPTLVPSGDGLLLCYVTGGRGGHEVRVRRLADGEPQGADIVIAESDVDAYDAVAASDGDGGLWIAYTALAGSEKYDVFVRRLLKTGKLTDAENVTESGDDAMHPGIAVAGDGSVWVTYLRWVRMGFYSRDKEIFVRCRGGDTWSDEVRLSPDDVPAHEDHTDPVIAMGPDGPVVAWSWDLHKMENEAYARYFSEYRAGAPTIFGRRLTPTGNPGGVLFLGEAGLDAAPTLHHAPDGRLWCAWNALGRSKKSLVTSVLDPDASDRKTQLVVEKGMRDVCSPRFIRRGESLAVLWTSQSGRGRWSLRTSTLTGRKWSKPVVLVKEGNPRLPSVAVDTAGKAWVAYVADTKGGRHIVVQAVP